MEVRPAPFTTGEIGNAPQKEAISLAALAETWPQLIIEPHDLLRLGFVEDEIAQLSTDDLAAIAQTMRQHLIHEWLPQELRFHVTERLSGQEQTSLPLPHLTDL